ncbi:MAG: response regulator [Dehalococcoidia bacterium]|nr:response regulator [Dehalococcoidia bacterium]
MPKILVIDNEENLRKILQVNLTASGYEVITASNGEEGLALMEREKPDLVLLDIKMPGISGWEVLNILNSRPNLKDIPVIIMTAFLKSTEEARMKTTGVTGFLAKPFDVQELLDQVGKVHSNKKSG